MSLRSRNAALLAKIESVEGQAESLDPALDAILVENPQVNLNPQNTQTNEVTGSLDDRGPIVGGLQASITFDLYLKGSGVAGTAPEWGKLLRACGWAEVITATEIPAVAEACAAGGSTTLAILGASAAATDQLYRGMPILLSGDVAGTSFISDYTADREAMLTDTMSAAVDGDSNYQIPVNVLYRPASVAIPSLTVALFMDGVKYLLAGCRGSFTVAATAGGPWRASFTVSGMFIEKVDAAVPAATYDATRPPIWRDNASLLDRSAAACRTLNFDNGTQTVYPEDPNAPQGFTTTEITRRAMTGAIDPLMTLVATRNVLADLQAGTQRILHARVGATPGNRLGFTVPTALFTGASPGDRDGLLTEQVNFQCVGQDAGAFIRVY